MTYKLKTINIFVYILYIIKTFCIYKAYNTYTIS